MGRSGGVRIGSGRRDCLFESKGCKVTDGAVIETARVLIAADKFKGSLTAVQVAERVTAGLRRVVPGVTGRGPAGRGRRRRHGRRGGRGRVRAPRGAGRPGRSATPVDGGVRAARRHRRGGDGRGLRAAAPARRGLRAAHRHHVRLRRTAAGRAGRGRPHDRVRGRRQRHHRRRRGHARRARARASWTRTASPSGPAAAGCAELADGGPVRARPAARGRRSSSSPATWTTR